MHIRLPGSMLHYIGHREPLHYPAASIREALDLLVADYPPLKMILLDPQGAVQPFHSLFLNGEQIRNHHLDDPAAAEDRLEVVTAIAGG